MNRQIRTGRALGLLSLGAVVAAISGGEAWASAFALRDDSTTAVATANAGDASAAAEQLLVMQPNNLEALLEGARDKEAANQGFYAIDLTQRAAALAPHDWRPISLMAIALEQSDRQAEALAAHQRALALAPDNAATLTNLGMYYAAHGQAAEAEPLLRRAASAPGATARERRKRHCTACLRRCRRG